MRTHIGTHMYIQTQTHTHTHTHTHTNTHRHTYINSIKNQPVRIYKKTSKTVRNIGTMK